MLDHHIQKTIVYKLALASSLRFSELKPDLIESKLFDYHLKKVISAGYVQKNEDGRYSLTSEGKLLGVHVLGDTEDLISRAHSVLFLVVRRSTDGAWLLYKRLNHPLRGGVGFMHAEPAEDELVAETASRVCKEKTGLIAEFKVNGSGYFRIFSGKQLESFTHFTLLSADNVDGELSQNDELAQYYWADDPLVLNDDFLSNMPLLLNKYLLGKLFFIDEIIQI